MKIWLSRIKKLYKLLPPLLVRDLKERYAGSMGGLMWTFVQPLITILIFWFVFSEIMKVRVRIDTGEMPFLPFLLSGLLPWFAIQEGISRGASCVVEKGYIIKKVFYPAELFPVSAVLSSSVHHGIGFVFFVVIYFFIQGGVSLYQVVMIPALVVLQIFITLGLAFLLSSLSVYIRDILQALGLVLQALFYLTTILYPLNQAPDRLRPILLINPFTWLIEAYHSVILYSRPPEDLTYLTILSFALLFVGCLVFRRLKGGFADVL